jgi:dynein heavy chain
MFLKSTFRPDFRPTDPDPNNKRELPDENTWVFDEYDKLRSVITRIIEPLDHYIATYDRFQKEYDFDPDKEMQQYEDPENWPDVDTLRSSILFHKSEEERLQHEIPEEIICSVFKVSTKVIRDMLAAKHAKIAEEQIVLISKIAKATSDKILDDFEKSNMKVEGVPKNIEELSNIKEYMQGLPKELEKKQNEIKNCMKIYECLDEFHNKFDDEEEYDKMWRVFGSPLETVQRIEKQQGFLEKEKEKFIKQMENNKKDFN